MADPRDRTLRPGGTVAVDEVRRLLNVDVGGGQEWHFARVAERSQTDAKRKFSDAEQLAEQIQRRLDALADAAEARGQKVRRERVVVAHSRYAWNPFTRRVVIRREWR